MTLKFVVIVGFSVYLAVRYLSIRMGDDGRAPYDYADSPVSAPGPSVNPPPKTLKEHIKEESSLGAKSKKKSEGPPRGRGKRPQGHPHGAPKAITECYHFKNAVCKRGTSCNHDHLYEMASMPQLCFQMDYIIATLADLGLSINRLEEKIDRNRSHTQRDKRSYTPRSRSVEKGRSSRMDTAERGIARHRVRSRERLTEALSRAGGSVEKADSPYDIIGRLIRGSPL